MTRDEAIEFTLAALADMPSGPPAEEILAVIHAAAWEEGREVGLAQDFDATTQITNPYTHDDTQGEK